MLTTITMILVIAWAIRQICRELGLTEIARNKLHKKYDSDD